MPTLTYLDTMHRTLVELMRQDESIIAMGGWGAPKSVPSVRAALGPGRVVEPPVSEMATCGAAIGAAVAGMRPVVSMGLASFMINGWEQLVNEMAVHHYMSGGRIELPLVIHCSGGVEGGEAAQHSYSPQAALWNTPGLKIVLPATPADLQGLLVTALADPNPVIIVDQRQLFRLQGEIADVAVPIPFGVADVRRRGSDVTVVATSIMVHHALTAADQLSAEGIGAEVIDPRTLVPFDEETILASVRKTGHLVVVDESRLSCGVAAEIAARLGHSAFGTLRAPIERVATLDVPIPFSKVLEQVVVPTPKRIAEAARRAVAGPTTA